MERTKLRKKGAWGRTEKESENLCLQPVFPKGEEAEKKEGEAALDDQRDRMLPKPFSSSHCSKGSNWDSLSYR